MFLASISTTDWLTFSFMNGTTGVISWVSSLVMTAALIGLFVFIGCKLINKNISFLKNIVVIVLAGLQALIILFANLGICGLTDSFFFIPSSIKTAVKAVNANDPTQLNSEDMGNLKDFLKNVHLQLEIQEAVQSTVGAGSAASNPPQGATSTPSQGGSRLRRISSNPPTPSRISPRDTKQIMAVSDAQNYLSALSTLYVMLSLSGALLLCIIVVAAYIDIRVIKPLMITPKTN